MVVTRVGAGGRRGRPTVDLVAVSHAAAAVLARRQGRATVAELAEAAGISVRTFHRHFPNKEDVLRPLFREGGHEIAAELRKRPADETVAEAFLAAWEAVAGGRFTERTRTLMPIVLADPRLTTMMDQLTAEGAEWLAAALAPRLGVPADDPAAETVAATLLAQMRLAVIRSVATKSDAVEQLRAQFADLARLDVFRA
ncbi:MAG TPA: helix-turn-helix domain-containing protein [Amycolatopsis sp.]|nr:helix-turn-helix domain-containing protein [Amycolatopsis sp.]